MTLGGKRFSNTGEVLTADLLRRAMAKAAEMRGEPRRWSRQEILAQCRAVGLSQEATDKLMRDIDDEAER